MLGCKINRLVTFAPSQERFLAHPLALMELQAQALGLPHHVLAVEEPYERGYEKAISSLREEHGIDTLVTGDVSEIVGHDADWMAERSARCGVNLLRPLWHRDGLELLNRLLSLRFRAVFSCVKKPWFTEEWLGLELSRDSVERLCELGERTGLDICGEQGEYHTLVLDGPRFEKRVTMVSYSKHVEDSLMYISPESLRLVDKEDRTRGPR
jgi:uncharacterized protein (TIGR00290 family)